MESTSTACTRPIISIPQEIKPNTGRTCKIQILVGGSLVVPLGPSSGAQVFWRSLQPSLPGDSVPFLDTVKAAHQIILVPLPSSATRDCLSGRYFHLPGMLL